MTRPRIKASEVARDLMRLSASDRVAVLRFMCSRLAESVTCPRCNQPPGQSCMNGDESMREHVHHERHCAAVERAVRGLEIEYQGEICGPEDACDDGINVTVRSTPATVVPSWFRIDYPADAQ